MSRFSPLALALAMLPACAGGPPPASPPAASPAAPPAATAPSTAPAESPDPAVAATDAARKNWEAMRAEVQPPDGKWLVAEDGRRYYLVEVQKVEGQYFREPDGILRLPRGLRLPLDHEDESHFWCRVYELPPFKEPSVAPAKPDPAPIEASYRPDSGESDRLRFERFDRGLPTRGQWRQGFDLADMNGDGHLDLVSGPPRKTSSLKPVIFLGDGAGGWRSWREASYPPAAYDYGDVEVADFNGDGRPDLALAMHLRGLMVLVSAGDGRFEPWTTGLPFEAPSDHAGGSGYTSRTIVATDWDGDGRTDLVALGEGPRMRMAGEGGTQFAPVSAYDVAVFLNQGDGSWRRLEDLPSAPQVFGEDLSVGDLDRDGKPDLAIAVSSVGASKVLRESAGGWEMSTLPLRPRGLVQAIEIADLDGDGSPEVIIGYTAKEGIWRTGVDVYRRAAAGWERQTLGAGEGNDNVFGIATGDVDGDGRADVAATTGEGAVWLFLNRGDGRFDRETGADLSSPDGEGCRGYDIHLADLDRDGRAEIAVEFAGEPSSGPFDVMDSPDAKAACASEGAIAVWRPLVAATAVAP